MEYRKGVMLGNKAKNAYELLVREYKYMNNTVRIDDFLENVFNRALLELKTKQYSVCSEVEIGSRITLNQAKFKDVFHQRHGYLNWTDKVKEKYKIPLEEFLDLIVDVFKVKSRDVITKHKKSLLKFLNLMQIRKGNSYYIVHIKHKDSDLLLKNYFDKKESAKSKYEQIVKIAREEGISREDLVNYISGDEELKKLISKSKELTFDENSQKLIIRDYSYIDNSFFDRLGVQK